MKVEWDANKNTANVAKHGVSFELVNQFEFSTANIQMDSRTEYHEIRYKAQGFVQHRLYILIFTMRGDCIRVISLRKANKREIRSYYHG